MIEFFASTAPVFKTHVVGDPVEVSDFVRFTPTAEMTDSEIRDLKMKFESLGAVVKVLPRAKKKKTVPKEKSKVKARTARQVVKALVDSSVSSKKTELDQLCQTKMDEFQV